MISQNRIKEEVRYVLDSVRPQALSPDEILDRLAFSRELIQECREQIGVGARFAAVSRVRDALGALGADVELNFEDSSGGKTSKVVFRLGEHRW